MARKALTLKQAEAQIEKNAPDYRAYVAAQVERKNAKSKKDKDAAQAKMDKLRGGYTGYRTAYRDFLLAGGTRRKPKSDKPKSTAKSSAKKSSGKRTSRKVTTKKLSKAAMTRRDAKVNPDGKTDAQLAAEHSDVPNAEVLHVGSEQ